LDKKLNIRLFELIKNSEDLLAKYIICEETGRLTRKIENFYKDRFKALLADKGFAEDLVDAAIFSSFEKPYETYQRVDALSKLIKESSFAEAWKVVERTSNILKGNKEQLPEKPEAGLLQEDIERQVFESFTRAHEAIRQAANSRDFRLATSLYAEAFFDILNKFFEKVFVNAEDLAVRKNRLALLRDINWLYTKNIADLSKIKL
jgi:glycyl-tRNA synthetase beta chain